MEGRRTTLHGQLIEVDVATVPVSESADPHVSGYLQSDKKKLLSPLGALRPVIPTRDVPVDPVGGFMPSP